MRAKDDALPALQSCMFVSLSAKGLIRLVSTLGRAEADQNGAR